MAFVKLVDELRQNPKWLQLRKHGPAKLLWVEVLVACNDAKTDGMVQHYVLEQWAFGCDITTTKQLDAATTKLVEVGLWHDHETIIDCEECAEEVDVLAPGGMSPGSFYVHGYLEHQPRKDEVNDPMERKRWRRKKALHRDVELTTAIRQRDHDRCRFCGIDVNFKARTGDQSGTFDHTNPNDFGSSKAGDNDGGNALHKIVVACRRCNGIKKNRTPDEAGMPLLPVPGNYDPATGEALAHLAPLLAAPGPGSGNGQDNPGPGQEPSAPARETGRGRDGPGRGQDRAGPAQAGSRSGRRGPGKAGGGPSRAGSGRGGTSAAGSSDPPPDPRTGAHPSATEPRSS